MIPIRTSLATFAALLAAAAPCARASSWSVYETAKDNDHRLTDVTMDKAPSTGEGASAGVIAVDSSQQFQSIEGFGGALTESSGWVLGQLSPESRAAVMRKYYDPNEGIGYTLARTHINSCDFSIGEWSLDPVPGDTDLAHFSLKPMRSWVMPLLHDAQSAAGASNFHLLASPWSPPSWMKTNGKMTDGGSLKPQYRKAWADYFVRFVSAMDKEEHIPVWALTVQNEPEAVQTWESCVYSAADERDFVRDYMGPALATAGMGAVHLLILDHNRDLFDKWTTTVYSDPAAAKFVWGTAMHWYVSEDYAAASRAHAAFPDKATLFTEGCNDRGEATGKWSLGQWDHGERYAHSMINDFRNWVCGWIDWNVVLDQTGGPNHVGNFCDAPVIVDTETGVVHYESAYYYIGQFSKFVHPGAKRVESHGGTASLESVAFVNPDGGLAVIVLNTGKSPATFFLNAAGEARSCSIPARAIQTYLRTP